MDRIIAHWTAGSHNASATDKKHYHYIIEGNGNVIIGDHPISANKNPIKGKYAAHTLRCNTGSIGISMACMFRAKERPFDPGKYPMTDIQFEVMCNKIAKLCIKYDIGVTRKTVLSHAEVEKTLGIKQRGKWDFTRLPFKPDLVGSKACGDYMRDRVRYYRKVIQRTHPPALKRVEKPKRIPWWKRLFGFFQATDNSQQDRSR